MNFHSFGFENDKGTNSHRGLLKPQKDNVKGRKTLVLDLDETLVHSSFKPTG